jgi:formylglycine-generating enzyme required for sulfatase activity
MSAALLRTFFAACAACFAFGSAASGNVGAQPTTFPPTFPLATRDCPDCPEMRPVTIATKAGKRTLMVGIYELTWQEYMVAVDEADCVKPRQQNGPPLDFTNGKLRDRYPMTLIQPAEIGCYLNWVKSKTGKTYRLPTDEEWMAVARIGVKGGKLKVSDLPSGERIADLVYEIDKKNCCDKRGLNYMSQIHRADIFIPNDSGIYGLFDNANEYVSDYVELPEFKKKINPKTKLIFVKGSSDFSKPNDDIISIRRKYFYNTISSNVGFRLVYERK